jgi:hypothetical protein
VLLYLSGRALKFSVDGGASRAWVGRGWRWRGRAGTQSAWHAVLGASGHLQVTK